MADTLKMASTFEAFRLFVGFEPVRLGDAISRFLELGLCPTVCGYEKNRVLVRLILPIGKDPHGSHKAIKKEYEALGGALLRATTTELIGPVD